MRRIPKAPGPRPAGRVLLALAACVASACMEAESPGAEPARTAARLAERVERALAERGDELRADLSHRSLLREVSAAEVEARLGHVHFFRGGAGHWLGGGGRVEPHGGGVLALLFRAWRPSGRPAGPDDAFPFANGRLALGAIYESHRRQVFLPDAPERLPRMRFLVPDGRGGARAVERDAFWLLGLLLAREPDLAATWENGPGQTLSVDALLERVLAVERASPPAVAVEVDSDHGRLHLVELLLAWYDRHLAAGRPPPFEPEALQARFLRGACATAAAEVRAAEDASPEVECLAHRTESLGRLAAHPAVRWSAEERARLAAFLDALEAGALRDPAGVHVAHLVHFALGLDRLRAGPSR